MNFADVESAIVAGSIDGAEVMPNMAKTWLDERTSLKSLVQNFRPVSGAIVINKNVWLDLTEEQRSILADAAFAANKVTNKYLIDQEKELVEQANAASVDLVSFQETDPNVVRSVSSEQLMLKGQDPLQLFQDLDNFRKVSEVDIETDERAPETAEEYQSSVVFITNRKDHKTEQLEHRFGLRENGIDVVCGAVDFEARDGRKVGDSYSGKLVANETEEVGGIDKCVDYIASKAATTDGRVLLFIHGFNNSFTDALRRGVSTKIDTQSKNTVLVWSWPSDGRALLYGYDEESVRWTEWYIESFIKKLVTREEVQVIDLFAHSMGSRLCLASLKALGDDNIKNVSG